MALSFWCRFCVKRRWTHSERRRTLAHVATNLRQNCCMLTRAFNAFTGDIARSMGYRVPSKYLRPQQFVTELREINTGRTGRI